jgi:hypothetical protein
MKYKKRELDAVELGGKLLVRGKGSQQVHLLNSTAAAIWKFCDGKNDVSDTVAHLAREFPGCSEEEIERDVRAALSAMSELGIVRSIS